MVGDDYEDLRMCRFGSFLSDIVISAVEWMSAQIKL
jgi:hypothetical protein